MPSSWPRAALSQHRAPRHNVGLNVLSGTVPPDLHGQLWLIGPAGVGDGRPSPDRPLFSGDGRLWRIDLRTRTADAALVLGADAAHDRADAPPWSRFRDLGLLRLSPQWGSREFAHTSVVPLQRRRGRALLVCADAARPVQVDPDTLRTIGPWGGPSPWRPAALGSRPHPVHLTTGHPAHDADTDELFVSNHGPDFTHLLRWDTDDHLTTTPLLDPSGHPLIIRDTLHQVVLTKNHVLLVDSAFSLGPDQVGLGRFARRFGPLGRATRALWSRPPTSDGTLWIVPRAALTDGRPAHATPVRLDGGIGHLIADDDDTPHLVLHLADAASHDLATWLHRGDRVGGRPPDPGLVGMLTAPHDVGTFARLVVDPTTGHVLHRSETWDAQRTWALGLQAGRGIGTPNASVSRHEHLWWFSIGLCPELSTDLGRHLARRPGPRRVSAAQRDALLRFPGLPCRLLRVDTASPAIVDDHALPDDTALTAPQLVPTDDGPGWLVVTTWSPRGAELWIYHPFELSRGPVCRLGAPEFDPGFLMHAAWWA